MKKKLPNMQPLKPSIPSLQIAKCVPAHNTQITRMVISNSERAMFMGLWTGAIRLYTYPLSEPYEWTEYRNHFAPITGVGGV